LTSKLASGVRKAEPGEMATITRHDKELHDPLDKF
jgi:hypothetical protein